MEAVIDGKAYEVDIVQVKNGAYCPFKHTLLSALAHIEVQYHPICCSMCTGLQHSCNCKNQQVNRCVKISGDRE